MAEALYYGLILIIHALYEHGPDSDLKLANKNLIKDKFDFNPDLTQDFLHV